MRSLAAAAKRDGNGMRAVRATVRLPARWTRKRVIAALQKCFALGGSDIPRGLRQQCRRLFGDVWAARAAANAVVVRRPWSRERVIIELRELAARGGALGQNLRRACLQRFGSVENACLTAGITSQAITRTQWTRSRVIAEIRQCAISGGSMSRSLLTACNRLFGTVAIACRKANAEAYISSSTDEILRQIRRHRGPVSTLLSIACIKTFGSVDAARVAAALANTGGARYRR